MPFRLAIDEQYPINFINAHYLHQTPALNNEHWQSKMAYFSQLWQAEMAFIHAHAV